MDKAVLIEAMSVAGYEYDDIGSYDEWVNFFSDYGPFSFDSWQDVEDWLRGVVLDNPDISDLVERIMRGE